MENRNVIIPNTITMLNLLAGIYSIVVTMDGRFFSAAVAIMVAMVFDGLDGKVARLTNGASEFGVQLDSLADVVSFGVAPALLVYTWQLSGFEKVGLMVTFLYAACGALRLARFNVQTKVISNVFFVGMPIPGAAALVATGYMFATYTGLDSLDSMPVIALVMLALFAFLMVSTIPYFSFKNLKFIKLKMFNKLIILVIILVLLGIEPQTNIFIALLLYVISGFVMIPFRQRLLLRLDRLEAKADNE